MADSLEAKGEKPWLVLAEEVEADGQHQALATRYRSRLGALPQTRRSMPG